MPKLEFEDNHPSSLLFNPQPAVNDLSADDQEALVSHFAQELEQDPSKLEQLAAQVIREQKAQQAQFKTMEIQPEAGFVCKTKTTTACKEWPIGSKVFINICYAAQVPEPNPAATEADIQKALQGDATATYQVPMSLGAPRRDHDRAGHACMVVDACVHTKPFVRAEGDLDYRLYIIELAIELIEDREKVELSREFTMPNLRSKGTIPKRMLQVPKGSLITDAPTTSKEPLFSRPDIHMVKKQLIVAYTMQAEVAKQVVVDIQPKAVLLSLDGQTHNTPLPVQIDVDSANNSATYHKTSKHLVLQLQGSAP
ncbi:hypothetical protein INT43_008319 [Umbelopsis isabellina]|uniref:PIH1 N-terminal domain-containing protein n=1 Tax=Mortierella isabellina TaxID=91625 RepID=A0A8H7U9C9_MORIS|nr:hypothetical protein INT43_008319 [Umbelopsis isabellina]